MSKYATSAGVAGPEAIRQWLAQMLRGDGYIECGECWTPERGWRVYMRTGVSAIVLPPKLMQRVGRELVDRAGRVRDMAEVVDLGREMLDVAAAAKNKQARRFVPPDALAFLPPMGAA